MPDRHRPGSFRQRATHRRARRLPARRSRRPSRRSTPLRQPPRRDHRRLARGARSRLSRFRQASALAVALTGLLLLVGSIDETAGQYPSIDPAAPAQAPDAAAAPVKNDSTANNEPAADDGPASIDVPEPDPGAALEEATGALGDLVRGFLNLWPKILLALLLLGLAWALSRAFRWLLHRFLRTWEKSEAVAAMGRIVFFLLAIGAGLSVISGDATALVGSVGLAGLALSWALQTPIESFTGWVLNAIRGYYRAGDRIEVGDVFGDVYRIDVLTTTVWEAGGPGKSVSGAQPTGALITFPNWEILRSNIINYSRVFPFVWDEVTFAIANESDLSHTISVFRRVATDIVGPMMDDPAAQYRKILEREGLYYDVESEPQVYLSLADSWTNCTVRYLVPVRQRRRWASELIEALSREMAQPEHQGRIIGGYPHSDIVLLDRQSRPGATERTVER